MRTTSSIVYICLEIVAGIFGTLGNLIAIIAIRRAKHLHTIANVFICNLAIADFAVGVFVAPCAIIAYLGYPHNAWGCIFVDCVILIFSNASVFMILAVAIDRFVAIKYPFFYVNQMSKRLAFMITSSLWFLGLVFGCIPFWVGHADIDKIDHCGFTGVIEIEFLVYMQFFVVMLLPLIIMIIIYVYIMTVIAKHFQSIRRLSVSEETGVTALSRRSEKRWFKEVRGVKTFGRILLLFGVFWMPSNVLNVIALFYPSHHIPEEVFFAALCLNRVNSCANPFLYAANSRDIAYGMKRIIGCAKKEEDPRKSYYSMQSSQRYQDQDGTNNN